jgi:uncharacterized protein YjbI with pentapeptide repeats
MTSPSPVAAIPAGPVACGTALFRAGGRLHVTVVVKVELAFAQNGPMTVVPAEGVAAEDIHYDNDPSRSLWISGELAPYLRSVDVVFTGHAHAPQGRPATAVAARIAVAGERLLLDKTVHVYGDYPAPGAPARPFQWMPVVYERALGGFGWAENPIGTGPRAAFGEAAAMPNVVDPVKAGRPAGFGPIARSWPVRKRLLGSLPRQSLDGPVAEIPEGFDWSYFQAAPRDQRIEHLRGDETIILEGLDAALPRLVMRLPGLRGQAFVYWIPPGATALSAPSPIALRADTLRLDGDRRRCTVLFRGSFPVESEAALSCLRIAGGVELPGQPVAWPDAARILGAPGPAEAPRAADADEPGSSTVALTVGQQMQAARAVIAPFALARPGDPTAPLRPAPIPGAPWSAEEAVAPPPVEGAIDATTVLLQRSLPAAPPAAWTPPASADATPEPLPPIPVAAAEIPVRTTEAIPVVVAAPLEVATLPWRVRPPRDSITVIVKGTFDLVPGGAAAIRDEAEPLNGDLHLDDDPARSMAYASDFAVFKPKADVTLVGHAHGGAKGVSEVRFRFGHDKNRFERRIAVLGDRSWSGQKPGAPAPFERIALTWENAFGGPSFDANPLGAGHEPSAARPPNLEDPKALLTARGQRPAPVCFAPVPPLWKERWSKLGTYDARWLERRWPWFPEDFDWTHFQAAPTAQQLEHLRGDEPFEIVGAHPEHHKLAGTLPKLRARCFVQRSAAAGGRFEEVVLHLDTAAFDADALALHLVWRGLLEASDDEAPEMAAIFAMTESLDGPRATLEDARAKYLAAATPLEPVPDEPDDEVANDVAPQPEDDEGDREIAAVEEQARAREQQILEELRAAGIPEEELTGAAPPPAPPGPAAFAETLRGAGASEEEIAEMLAVLQPIADQAEEPEPGEPELRAVVISMLEKGELFDEMDLEGADLSGLDFSRRSLAGANLRGASLKGSRLEGADLRGASLGGADLGGATLDRADLTEADLAEAGALGATFVEADLTDADLSGCKGDGACFRRARGARTQFAGGSWVKATFEDATIEAPDFTDAMIGGAVFDGAVMPEIRLYGARGARVSFDRAKIPEARADGVSLTQSSLRGVAAPDSVWESASLDGSTLFGGDLRGASFVRASCEGVIFSGAELTGARFKRAILGGAQFLKANLMTASFEKADLSRADLRGANLYGAETWNAKLEGARLELAFVARSKLEERR